MQITQVWLDTSIDYLSVPDGQKDLLTDALLGVPGISEVSHYSEICVLYNVGSDDDAGFFQELRLARVNLTVVFQNFGLAPQPTLDVPGLG